MQYLSQYMALDIQYTFARYTSVLTPISLKPLGLYREDQSWPVYLLCIEETHRPASWKLGHAFATCFQGKWIHLLAPTNIAGFTFFARFSRYFNKIKIYE